MCPILNHGVEIHQQDLLECLEAAYPRESLDSQVFVMGPRLNGFMFHFPFVTLPYFNISSSKLSFFLISFCEQEKHVICTKQMLNNVNKLYNLLQNN